MNKTKIKQILSLALCGVMCASTCTSLVGCNNKESSKKKSSVVIMTEELSGLFNPFYATAGADMDVVGMTQIGMLSTDKEGLPVAGDDEPTVVKAFTKDPVYNAETNESVYTFVLKNDLKFSDGQPLTMEDVLFNMYVYLDPVYTGSSTMYSIDIKGLTKYRTQSNYSDTTGVADQNANKAMANAILRRLELVNVFETAGDIENSDSFKADDKTMRDAIAEWEVTSGYKMAVATQSEISQKDDAWFREKLLKDYEFTLETFREELQSDFKAAKESFDLENPPYKEHAAKLKNDIFKFFLYEGKIRPVYADDPENPGKKDKLKIESFDNEEIASRYTTEEAAIERMFNDTTVNSLNAILTQWGTAGTLLTQYTAEALDVILRDKKVDGKLQYSNIEGIVSLGHMNDTSNTTKITEVTVGGKTYKVAHEHDKNGVPTAADTYDVLQITINGTDPKAIYNFGFTVAPSHYYGSANGTGSDVDIDISNDKFGVEWASSSFQSDVIQSQRNVEVPVGAGPFMATNENNANNPKGSEFWSSNIVYFKANENFMFDVKADKFRMQVISSSNALDALANGQVDYVTPQFTKANSERLLSMEKQGFTQLSSWQLGYGYIGINAGKVPNVNIRRAIMAAMETTLACEFYESGTCKPIDWPMSTVSWAYPFEDDGKTSKPNGHDYTQWTDAKGSTTFPEAKAEVQRYMKAAGVSANDSQLDITFTIAGASITDHPTYAVFKQASEILNSLGWNVEVKADSQALTKLATGSLEVWAAAWGSTVDPDMYQVYHMNSSATSVYAWGYREIKSNQSLYSYEYGKIVELSKIIDKARSINDQAQRTADYEDAMEIVLDLAVELPVYQRMTLYAYNNKTIKGLSEDVNPYSSPLEKLWEIELV